MSILTVLLSYSSIGCAKLNLTLMHPPTDHRACRSADRALVPSAGVTHAVLHERAVHWRGVTTARMVSGANDWR
jgi:hypothetical protein